MLFTFRLLLRFGCLFFVLSLGLGFGLGFGVLLGLLLASFLFFVAVLFLLLLVSVAIITFVLNTQVIFQTVRKDLIDQDTSDLEILLELVS